MLCSVTFFVPSYLSLSLRLTLSVSRVHPPHVCVHQYAYVLCVKHISMPSHRQSCVSECGEDIRLVMLKDTCKNDTSSHHIGLARVRSRDFESVNLMCGPSSP
jgi:hypothetical protein